MKVKLKENKGKDYYLPLKFGKEYTVLCVDFDLDNNDQGIYLYEESNDLNLPSVYPMQDFSVVDSTIPDDWVTRIFTKNIGMTTLVCAPPFIADNQRFFIDLHDINLSRDEVKKIADYISSQ